MIRYLLAMFYGFIVGYDSLLGAIRLSEGNLMQRAVSCSRGASHD